MDERRSSEVARLACGALSALVVTWLAMDHVDNPVGALTILAAAFVAGGLGRSWWAVVLVPAAIAVAIVLYGQTDCPDCGGGGDDDTSRELKLLGFAIGFGILALGTAAGAGLERVAGLLRAPSGEQPRPLISGGAWTLGAISLVILSIALPVIRFESNRDENGRVIFSTGSVRYREGRPWDAERDGSLSEAELAAFREYPLYWLGTSFGGYRLTFVDHRPGSLDVVNQPGADGVALVYGTCGPAPCSPPVQVNVQPACSVTPSALTRFTASETLPSGAILRRTEPGSAAMWSRGSFLTIHSAPQPALLDEILSQLRTVQPPAKGLEPPDFSKCPNEAGVG